MKKVLITGGSGFIGRSLNEYLSHAEKYEILSPSSKELNLLSEEAVNSYLKHNCPEVIIHAANYGVGMDKTKDAAKVFENIMRMFLNLEKNSDYYGKLIHLGSGAEFDKRYPIINVREEELGKHIPMDQYGMAKYTIEKMTESDENIYNLRLFGIFGPREPWQVKFISNICCKAIKGLPLTIRQNVYFDYLWIYDFCRIVEWFLDETPKYHTYNIATGQRVDLITLCNIVNRISGKQLPVYIGQKGLGNEYTADNHRLMEELKKFKFTSIESAVKELYSYYESIQDEINMMPLLYQ